MEFRWNGWNVEHVGRHGVAPQEAEDVVRGAHRPYPLHREDDKWLVWGRTEAGRMLQVVYVLDDEDRVFVIHAPALTDREGGRFCRRRR